MLLGKLDLFRISHLLYKHVVVIIYYWQILYTLGKSTALQPLKVDMSLLGRQ